MRYFAFLVTLNGFEYEAYRKQKQPFTVVKCFIVDMTLKAPGRECPGMVPLGVMLCRVYVISHVYLCGYYSSLKQQVRMYLSFRIMYAIFSRLVTVTLGES